MAKTPEGAVKDAVKKLLHRRGWIAAGSPTKNWPEEPRGWYYMPVQSGMGVHGIPDVVGFETVEITPEMVGRRIPMFVSVETKAPGRRGDTSANQKSRHDEIRRADGLALVVDDAAQIEVMLRA